MSANVVTLGFELIVDDLDRAVALWTDVLGFELVERRPSPTAAGEIAIVGDGQIAITLLHPAGGGAGHLLADRSPRLSQIVLGADPTTARSVGDAATEGGLTVVPTDSGFYLAPEAVGGALGSELAIVVTTAAHR